MWRLSEAGAGRGQPLAEGHGQAPGTASPVYWKSLFGTSLLMGTVSNFRAQHSIGGCRVCAGVRRYPASHLYSTWDFGVQLELAGEQGVRGACERGLACADGELCAHMSASGPGRDLRPR